MSVGSISNSEIDFSRRKKKKFEIGFFGKVALIGDMCIKGFPFAHQIPFDLRHCENKRDHFLDHPPL